MKIKHIFFDFDGVLAESVSAKTEAFRDMYAPFGEDVSRQVVAHHIQHGGVSRYEKFKIYHEQFLGETINNDKVDALAKQFSSLVLDKVICSKEVPGAKWFLEKYYGKLNYWIITGTPTKEIEIIAQKRELASFFKGLHGSPKNKKYWTEYLIKQHRLDRNEIIFLGDATTDLEAAEHSGLHFALRDNEENEELFKNYNGLRFANFEELDHLLQTKKLI